jgi:acyl-coenzyme A thioesterase PaaI-like protein
VRHAGRRVHQWGVTMRDAEDGRELATSTVRLLLVDPEKV